MTKYVKPTLKTKFHIDFSWWNQGGKNLHRYLLSHTCAECAALVEQNPDVQTIDWVDPETGQVFAIDRLWHTINTHCSKTAGFIPETLPLAETIFRLFIANDNTPLTPIEIQQKIQKKDSKTILRTIGRHIIYRGIRPAAPLVSK